MIYSKKVRLTIIFIITTCLFVPKAHSQWQFLRLLVRGAARSAASSTVRSAIRGAARITKPVRKVVQIVDALGNISYQEQVVQEEVMETETESQIQYDALGNPYRVSIPQQQSQYRIYTDALGNEYSLDEINNISTQEDSYNSNFLENEYRLDVQSGYTKVLWNTPQEAGFVACLCQKFRWSDGRVQRGRVAQYLNEAGFRINGFALIERWHLPVYP
ncbi:MAG: hypothetical protein RL757_3145 [Bacteroidota bacterium]|jgi:hypothetical protein